MVEEKLLERDTSLQILKDNLVKAQERMKKMVDARRTEREFEVGDWVYLRLQPYRQTSRGGEEVRSYHPSSMAPIKCCKGLEQ